MHARDAGGVGGGDVEGSLRSQALGCGAAAGDALPVGSELVLAQAAGRRGSGRRRRARTPGGSGRGRSAWVRVCSVSLCMVFTSLISCPARGISRGPCPSGAVAAQCGRPLIPWALGCLSFCPSVTSVPRSVFALGGWEEVGARVPWSRSLGERRGHGGWWGVGGGPEKNPRLLAGALRSGAFCAVSGPQGPVSGVFRPWGGQLRRAEGEKPRCGAAGGRQGDVSGGTGRAGGRKLRKTGVEPFYGPFTGWSGLGRVKGVKGGSGALRAVLGAHLCGGAGEKGATGGGRKGGGC